MSVTLRSPTTATPPYFHDGRVPTLPRAVDRMAWRQFGIRLPSPERDAIVALLGALTDRSRP